MPDTNFSSPIHFFAYLLLRHFDNLWRRWATLQWIRPVLCSRHHAWENRNLVKFLLKLTLQSKKIFYINRNIKRVWKFDPYHMGHVTISQFIISPKYRLFFLTDLQIWRRDDHGIIARSIIKKYFLAGKAPHFIRNLSIIAAFFVANALIKFPDLSEKKSGLGLYGIISTKH